MDHHADSPNQDSKQYGVMNCLGKGLYTLTALAFNVLNSSEISYRMILYTAVVLSLSFVWYNEPVLNDSSMVVLSLSLVLFSDPWSQ